MLSADDIAALQSARHDDPFAVLGPHAGPLPNGPLAQVDPASAGTGTWVRAILPGAVTVAVVEAASGRFLADLARHEGTDVFEGVVAGRLAAYRLRVRWHDGVEGDYADPYAFGPQLGEEDIHYLGEGSHQRPYTVLGAHVARVDGVDGTRFAVWAPNAARASVVGDFNGWDGRRHPMRLRHGAGVWEIFIPHVAPGNAYKYEIRARDGRILPLKADPYAFAAELRPATASKVAAMPARALPATRAGANRRDTPMAIYEVHLGSWRRTDDNRWLDWDALARELPAYTADLGFTHLELMPVAEHPFDGSWGYQVLGLYAPTARFGEPAGFGRFLDACQAAGLGVIVDWVPAHFPTDAHGLAQFDGTALYEYADPREGFHQDWNTLIYNFGRNEVRNFLVGNALYWLENWGVDGLRVDAVASMLYRDYSRAQGEWVPNVHGGRENLEAIAFLKRLNEVVGAETPHQVTIAEESTAFPGVSRPTFMGGLGFHFKWNLGWMHDTLAYMSEDPVHRKYHHNKLTFSLLYAFDENFILPLSHDEVVHGKRSILERMPGDRWQRFANLRAYYAYMWAHPGKKLLFMGGEFGQVAEWNHDRALDWRLLQHPEHRGVQALVRDLNTIYRSRPALHALDNEAGGFEWIDADDATHSTLAFVRKDGNGRMLLVLCNFTPVPRHGVRIGVPAGPAAWREVLNTDAAAYSGSGVGNGGVPLAAHAPGAHGRANAIVVTLPPLATLFLEPA
jgi:1,4-alpha-glucan branching enzyme